MIIRFLIGVPETLPPSVAERYPELAQARYRRGGIPPRFAGWLLGRPTVAAVTLWRTIWLGRRVQLDDELLLHEWRHVEQFGASPAFPLMYIWETLRRGYWMNRFEVEARDYAAQRIRGARISP
ncbi:MAG TPA: hypothetical protein VFO55_06080 [Gemmatimonadaceae bacterium]|nr:hypothetical protein [Gemmatimonadaceae bacterium]